MTGEKKLDSPEREKIEEERRRIQADIERAVSVFGLKVSDGVLLWNIIQGVENIEARTPKLGDQPLREEIKSRISAAKIYMKELTGKGESIEVALGYGADQLTALIPTCDCCERPLEVDAQKQKIVDAVEQERERIVEVIENLNSIGYPYGGNYKEAVLKTLKEGK